MKQVYTEAQRTLSENWIKQNIGAVSLIKPLAGDAGHRCYYRISAEQQSYIGVVDRNPESFRSFHQITHWLKQRHFSVPDVIASDRTKGWMILTDLGDTTLLNLENTPSITDGYLESIHVLCQLMQTSVPTELPSFSIEDLKREVNLFTEWFCPRILNKELTEKETEIFNAETQHLLTHIANMPQVFMHRDFHSANLMLHNHEIHMIDYQDARVGPYIYDFVSLTRDCYIEWPLSQRKDWYALLMQETSIVSSMETMLRDYRAVTLQRMLKCLGIFARLKHRDGKSQYLQHYPRMFRYLEEVFEDGEYPGIAQIFQNRGLV